MDAHLQRWCKALSLSRALDGRDDTTVGVEFLDIEFTCTDGRQSFEQLAYLQRSAVEYSLLGLDAANKSLAGIYEPPNELIDRSGGGLVSLGHDVKRSFSNCKLPYSRRQLQFICFHTLYVLLKKYGKLSYYQGLHDVASTLIFATCKVCTVAGGQRARALYAPLLALSILERQVLLYLRDFLSPDLLPSLLYLRWLGPLVYVQSNSMFALLASLLCTRPDSLLALPKCVLYQDSGGRVSPASKKNCWRMVLTLNSSLLPTFALSWVLTWFSHDLDLFSNFNGIAALWDFFFETGPVAPVYVASVLVANALQRVIELAKSEPQTGVDFPMLHTLMVSLISEEAGRIESVVESAAALYSSWPPERFADSEFASLRTPDYVDLPVWTSTSAVATFAMDSLSLSNSDSYDAFQEWSEKSTFFASLELRVLLQAEQSLVRDLAAKNATQLALGTRVAQMWLKKQLAQASLTFPAARKELVKAKSLPFSSKAAVKPVGLILGLIVLGVSIYISGSAADLKIFKFSR